MAQSTTPQGIMAVHDAVLAVYEGLRAVFFGCFPTGTNPTGNTTSEDAKRRLDLLKTALQPFPEKHIRLDPFFGLSAPSVQLSLPGFGKIEPIVSEAVEGNSLHDVVVRYAWRVYDSLWIVKLHDFNDPQTGESFQGVNYINGFYREVTDVIRGKEVKQKVFCSGGSVEGHHYSELPWTEELWDRIYSEYGQNLMVYCLGTSAFNPHPGELRKALVREMGLAYTSGRGKLEPVVAQAAVENGEPKKEVKGKNIDARMLKIIADNLDSHDWDSQTWASHLKCTSSTVRETKTWKQTLPKMRATTLLSRGEVKQLKKDSRAKKKPTPLD